MALWLYGLLLGCVSASSRLDSFRTVDDYMNVCVDGQNHKAYPGPEENIDNMCSPYKSRACCTAETTDKLLTNATWYGFSWDHCGRLSDSCRRHFQRDLCFYECSSSVGPWLVQEDRKWRKERFSNVPLCRSDCEEWFSDCRNDMTCVPNWSKDFIWINGVQTCPNDDSGHPSECMLFRNIYKHAKDFCEKVWDYSFKVVEDTEPCMRIHTDRYDLSNNTLVAYQRAVQRSEDRLIPQTASAVWTSSSLLTTVTVTINLALAYLA